MAKVRFLVVVAMTVAPLAPTLAEAQAVHGENSTFVGHGVALVWGVLRGAREDETQVVLRVALASRDYVAVSMEGVDPFTQHRKEFLAMHALGEPLDIRAARTSFADFPRREIHFYSVKDQQAKRPSLTVYFMGLPDTTPEFSTEVALGRYLTDTMTPLTSAKGPTQ